MAQALNEIRIDFELPDEHLDRQDKIRALKEIINKTKGGPTISFFC